MCTYFLDLNRRGGRIVPFFCREVATSLRNLAVQKGFVHVYFPLKQQIRNITDISTGLFFRRQVATSLRNLGVRKYSLLYVFVQSRGSKAPEGDISCRPVAHMEQLA